MKLILLQGLPASGKSTKAKEIVETGNYVRINRDLLRTMLHFEKWSPKNEDVTIVIAKAAAITALKAGKNVVIDDTNLSPKIIEMWKVLAATALEFPVIVEIIKIDTPIEECIRRDEMRKQKGERFVGPFVIKNMARQFRIKHNDKKDVLCDLDGTLCDITQRLHFVKSNDKKNWAGFFANIASDKPRLDVIEKLNKYKDTHNIVLVSARPDTYREETVAWLKKYLPFEYDTLIMRKSNDSREDSIVKQEILDAYFDKKDIELVFDDRPRVIRMWRENGIKVEDVGSGAEF